MGEIHIPREDSITVTGDSPSTVDTVRRPLPRPVLVGVTAALSVAATLGVVRFGGMDQNTPAETVNAGREAVDWALLYGTAMRKLHSPIGDPVINGVTAVGSGYHVQTAMDAGTYRMEIACASVEDGTRLEITVMRGDDEPHLARADCDADCETTLFTVARPTKVSIWVGSYRDTTSAYAFRVVPA